MVEIYGTLGPKCEDEKTLSAMFAEGMTGIRINLSHVMLKDCAERIKRIQRAAKENGINPKILIDMQGPEIRIGSIEKMELSEGESYVLGESGIPVNHAVIDSFEVGDKILLDDGRILAEVERIRYQNSEDRAVNNLSACGESKGNSGSYLSADKNPKDRIVGSRSAVIRVSRGGWLTSRKSLAVVGKTIDTPAMTESDMANIKLARECGVTAVMQPFVRSVDDLIRVRKELDGNGGKDIEIYAKIENMAGVNNLDTFFPYADEIVIARGDLGNAMPLWELPRVQKEIAKTCNETGKRFMVVTQMLSSMEHSMVPTRAEVSDIYNAVLDGASSVMVTGETAVGDYPVEVVKYLKKTANAADSMAF